MLRRLPLLTLLLGLCGFFTLLLPALFRDNSKVEGTYRVTTHHCRAILEIKTDGSFRQTVETTDGKLSLDGNWSQSGKVVEFSKLYYLIDLGERADLKNPQLVYIARFEHSGDILFVEDRPQQVYRR